MSKKNSSSSSFSVFMRYSCSQHSCADPDGSLVSSGGACGPACCLRTFLLSFLSASPLQITAARMFLDVQAKVGKLTSAQRLRSRNPRPPPPLSARGPSVSADPSQPPHPQPHHLLLNTHRLHCCRHWGTSRTLGHFACVISGRVPFAEISITTQICDAV